MTWLYQNAREFKHHPLLSLIPCPKPISQVTRAVTEWGEADLLSRNTECVLRAPPTPAEATQCLIGCLVWIIIYTKTKNWYHSPCTFSTVIHIFHWKIEILCMRHIIIITGLSECYQVEMNMWQNSNSPFVTSRDTITFSRDNVTRVTCYCHNLHQLGQSGKFQYYGVMVLQIDVIIILSRSSFVFENGNCNMKCWGR